MSDIKQDITMWSAQRLKQWMDDSMMRYEAAGLDCNQYLPEVVFSLMRLAASVLASSVSLDDRAAEQGGVHFTNLLKEARSWYVRSGAPIQ